MTFSISNQPSNSSVVMPSGFVANPGDVSAPRYGCGDSQPFFGCCSTAYANVAAVSSAARAVAAHRIHLAREPIRFYCGTEMGLCQLQ